MTEDETVKSLVETIEKLPGSQIEELNKNASYSIRKLIVTDMKERRRLIREQVNWKDSIATEDQKEQFLEKILFKYANIITVHDDEISSVKNEEAKFQIETVRPPIYQPPRPLSPGTLREVEKEVQKLYLMGRIAPANGEWACPIVVVHRPGETKICLCINFREVNKVTKSDKYPLP